MAADIDAWRTSLALAERLREEVERSVQQALQGAELLGAPLSAAGRSRKVTLARRGTMELVHYHAVEREVFRIPLLLVMAPTHHGYLLDLAPGQSLIEFLLLRGFDVYLLDWHAPTAEESGLALKDYVLDFLPDCLRHVQQDSGEDDVNVLGYCAGGLLAVMYQALHPQGPVKHLACLATPVDFSGVALFRAALAGAAFDVDALLDADGLVPADVVTAGFEALRPEAPPGGQIERWNRLWRDSYARGLRMMERWSSDTLPLPGACFRDLAQALWRDNALCHGTLRMDGRPVALGAIKIPLLHVVAEDDRIVPAAATAPLVRQVGSDDKTQVVLPGGHVSLAAGAQAVQRLWPELDHWLEERSV